MYNSETDNNINYDTEQLLQEMTEALKKASERLDEMADDMEKLEQENTFLTDTITQNNLGLITVERRKLLKEVREKEEKAGSELEEAQVIRAEFEKKLDRVSILIKDVSEKQNGIDEYIDKQAEDKVAEKIQKLDSDYGIKKKKLQKEYDGMKEKIQDKLKKRTVIMLISIATAVAIVMATILFLKFRVIG